MGVEYAAFDKSPICRARHVDLALHGTEGTVTRDEIAERQAISPLYLSHILLKLGKADLVVSTKGPGGGYQLAKHPSEILVGDVVRAVGEPLDLVACVAPGGSNCPRVETCAAHLLWVRLSKTVRETLDSVTLEELTQQAREVAALAGGPSQ